MARRQHAAPAFVALFSLVFTPAGICGGGGGDDGPAEGSPECLAEEPAPADGAPVVVIGTGRSDSFAPLGDGAQVEKFAGAQGGAHVNISLRGYIGDVELDPDSRYVFDMVYSGGGSGVADFLGDCPNQWQEAHTQRLFLDVIDPSSGTLTVQIREQGNPNNVLAEASVDIVVP